MIFFDWSQGSVVFDAAVFQRSILYNFLLLNVSLSYTFRSSPEILTFSSLFPSRSSSKNQMSKTPFNKAKAAILDLSDGRFRNEIPEVQFRINTYSFCL